MLPKQYAQHPEPLKALIDVVMLPFDFLMLPGAPRLVMHVGQPQKHTPRVNRIYCRVSMPGLSLGAVSVVGCVDE